MRKAAVSAVHDFFTIQHTSWHSFAFAAGLSSEIRLSTVGIYGYARTRICLHLA